MSTLFISVDVETSGQCPALGSLLTIGAVPVLEDGTVTADRFYARIDYDPMGGITWHGDTRKWWLSSATSAEAKRAAFGPWRDSDGKPHTPFSAAASLNAWLQEQLSKHNASEPCFVAHPVAFDWMWVADLVHRQLGHNPFGYKGLCLRSFGFGLAQRPWNEDRTDESDLYVAPALPHHALWDALAQAEQLSRMLRLREGRTP